MEGEQVDIRTFLEDASPIELSVFIAGLEALSSSESHSFTNWVKSFTFYKMELKLNIHRRVWKGKSSKRYPTEIVIHPKNNEIILFVSSKDSHDIDALRARLYDKYKDVLLERLDPDAQKRFEMSETLRALPNGGSTTH